MKKILNFFNEESTPLKKYMGVDMRVKKIYGKYHLECESLFPSTVLLKSDNFQRALCESTLLIESRLEMIKKRKEERKKEISELKEILKEEYKKRIIARAIFTTKKRS